jgi:hypothetical protein
MAVGKSAKAFFLSNWSPRPSKLTSGEPNSVILIGPLPGLPSRISRDTLSHPRITLSSRPAGTVVSMGTASVSTHLNCTGSSGLATGGTNKEL